ncbi:MAG: sulfatase-like hydrolase/transferase [Sedimentisphaerales bacterium]|nr:sulfatase-like hydrolase/transferase [Sedimentisphaerales bacterium]
MSNELSQSGRLGPWRLHLRTLRDVLAPRAHSAILSGALFCTLAVKFFHAVRSGLILEYPAWILTDVAVLLTLDVALSLICYRRPTKWVVRGAMIVAAVVCTWSVINAGWLIRTGTQILPMELRPLIRDPVNIFWMVLGNLRRMPVAAALLLIPSAIALAFLFSVLAQPQLPEYDRRRLRVRVIASLAVSAAAALGSLSVSGLAHITAPGLRSNCQSRAVLAFLLPRYRHLARNDFNNASRELPRYDAIPVRLKPQWINHNVVIVVLEGIQYDCTSLAAEQGGIAPARGPHGESPTPFLASLADEGVSFTNARAAVTHTTKALFALLTGRAPSASQDLGETVPTDQPYASLATILKRGLGFRTAFFQSATGSFEARPGLIHNLGFDKLWTREDLGDPNRFVGYLGSDEFAMLQPMRDWIQSEDKPFLLVALCSVTHDNYEVPQWFGAQPSDPAQSYRQTIAYTDQFLAALDTELANLHLTEDTIFCVVGDHGEGFNEHMIMGHERLAFEEVLRIAMCMRAPFLIEPGTRITGPVNSMDVTPTILGLLGFDIDPMHFDGVNALRPLPADRKVYFSCWMQQGPTGFIQQDSKYIYDPEHDSVTLYRLSTDPLELSGFELPKDEAQRLTREIIQWRRDTIFRIDQRETGHTTLYDCWYNKWNARKRNSFVKRMEKAQPGADPAL